MKSVFEKIIEKLEDAKSNVPVNRLLDDIIKDKPKELGQLMAYNKAIEIVKQEAEQYNNGWIPCSEPPENDRYVLLSFDNFSVPMVGRYEEDENVGAYYIGDDMEPCVTQDIFVNAWMNLPAPYQTKGE